MRDALRTHQNPGNTEPSSVSAPLGEAVIESIVATLALKGGGRLIRAAVENRDLGSTDAAEVASAFLEAVVAGQRKADADLQRIEQKVDRLSTDPYHAAMTSGSLLLSDAAPTHRRPDDRRQLLFDARKTFASAVGHAHGRPLDVARALVMYGMAGAALGSGEDLASSLDRATRILQFEVLTSFQLDCKWNREQEDRRAAPATKWREAILGPSSSQPDWSTSNRWYRATDEYDALWHLRMAADKEPGSCPRLPRPHGTAYSHPRPGLPVRIDLKTRTLLLDTWLTLDASGLSIDHRGGLPGTRRGRPDRHGRRPGRLARRVSPRPRSRGAGRHQDSPPARRPRVWQNGLLAGLPTSGLAPRPSRVPQFRPSRAGRPCCPAAWRERLDEHPLAVDPTNLSAPGHRDPRDRRACYG